MRSFFFLIGCLIWIRAVGQAQELSTNGAARFINTQCIEFRSTDNFLSGTFWTIDQFDFDADFDLIFRLNFSCAEDVDGLSFALQPTGAFVGNYEGRLGALDLSPSLIIEVDLDQNLEDGDPNFDHLAILLNGNLDHNAKENTLPPVELSASKTLIDRCQDHWLRIQFDADDKILVASFDCQERLRYTISDEVIALLQPFHWGCTAGLGASSESIEVCPDLVESILDTVFISGKCPGDTIVLFSEMEGRTYEWVPGIAFKSPFSRTTEIVLDQDASYQVVVTDDCGLKWKEDFRVQIDLHVHNFDIDTVLCQGEELSIDLSDQPFASTMRWNTGELSSKKTISKSGAYFLEGMGETCLSSDTMQITFFDALNNLLGPDRALCEGVALQLGDRMLTQFDFSWTDGSNLPFLEVDASGTYGFTIDHRCGTYKEEVTLELINCTVFIPTGFSPNGDQVNDFFKPGAVGQNTIVQTLEIFDRWGNRLYFTKNQELDNWSGWDGLAQGAMVPSGVYVYYMITETNGMAHSHSGTLTLLR